MTQTRAAQRYAKAILEIARQENAIDVVTEDFRTVGAAIEASRDLQVFLETPVIDNRVKETILREIFKGKLGAVMDRFIALLTRKGRAGDLTAIVDAFFQLLDQQQNIVSATITTAISLGDEQKKAIENRLHQLSGKNIRATYAVDPTIVGGFRARFGDTMIDASVRHQLDRMYETLVGGRGI